MREGSIYIQWYRINHEEDKDIGLYMQAPSKHGVLAVAINSSGVWEMFSGGEYLGVRKVYSETYRGSAFCNDNGWRGECDYVKTTEYEKQQRTARKCGHATPITNVSAKHCCIARK